MFNKLYQRITAAAFLLDAVLMLPLTALSVKAQAEEAAKASLRVLVNEVVLRDAPQGFVVDRTAYVPLRAVAEALDGRTHWNEDGEYAVVEHKDQAKILQGVIRNQNLFVKSEDIGQVFGVSATYDPAFAAVILDREDTPTTQEELLSLLPSYAGYTPEDVYWLSRIVEAEATAETYESRLAVASVILNRLRNDAYPYTVKEVIFDHRHGVQFTPTSNGRVFNNPSALSFLAAIDALEGRNNAPGALFFMNPEFATNFWVQKNRQFAFTIGGHSYYY